MSSSSIIYCFLRIQKSTIAGAHGPVALLAASSTASTGPQVQKRFMSPKATVRQTAYTGIMGWEHTIIHASDAGPEFLLL